MIKLNEQKIKKYLNTYINLYILRIKCKFFQRIKASKSYRRQAKTAEIWHHKTFLFSFRKRRIKIFCKLGLQANINHFPATIFFNLNFNKTPLDLKLAAVDIGSNAIRLQITHVTFFQGTPTFKKVEYIRFPLRLGHDVFTFNRISAQTCAKFIKLMQTFKNLIELYEVDDYLACATSAMREAQNGKGLAQIVQDLTGLDIEIISGKEEADIINTVIYKHVKDTAHLHIDVGGGSTELNLYYEQKKVAAKSFKIGSVRTLEHFDSSEMWQKIEQWINKKSEKIEGPVTAIGTGGNINKLFNIAKRNGQREGNAMSTEQLTEIQKFVAGYSLEDRINYLQLNPDRADVIIPASEIYLSCMKWANASKIIVPNVGLKDGIMMKLYKRHMPGKI